MAITEHLGTLEWSRRTGGKLSRKDREALVKEQVAREARVLGSGRLAGVSLASSRLARVDIDRVRFPDTATARRAEDLIAELCTPAIGQHCYRSYLWGSLLAQHDALAVDEELFYLASLLHDLGTTERHFARNSAVHCFAVEGALAADAFLVQEDWSPERRDLVAEAITLHVNLSDDLRHGAVAYCLGAGTRCDAMGQRACDIPQSAIQEVLRRHPGLGFGEEFGQFLQAEARVHPEGRIAWILANVGGVGLFPFADSVMNREASSMQFADGTG